MKTYVVRLEDGRTWTGNAESAKEAVAYARSRASLIADQYLVFDWNLDAYVVTVNYKAPEV